MTMGALCRRRPRSVGPINLAVGLVDTSKITGLEAPQTGLAGSVIHLTITDLKLQTVVLTALDPAAGLDSAFGT